MATHILGSGWRAASMGKESSPLPLPRPRCGTAVPGSTASGMVRDSPSAQMVAAIAGSGRTASPRGAGSSTKQARWGRFTSTRARWWQGRGLGAASCGCSTAATRTRANGTWQRAWWRAFAGMPTAASTRVSSTTSCGHMGLAAAHGPTADATTATLCTGRARARALSAQRWETRSTMVSGLRTSAMVRGHSDCRMVACTRDSSVRVDGTGSGC
mmetsp:Transcript_11944/g.27280  ORF Transcript_11944/g.27280 Transcript_11944/m.27280 type:complete len:214 (+) Transcript_11944:859-1500(+)